MKKTSTDLSSLFRTLTIDQLERLDAALTAARGGTVDIAALVEGMLATPPPVSKRVSEQRKSEIDSGRAYELTLDYDPETARAQYEAEWKRADALVRGGMSYEEAWKKIRNDTYSAR